MLEILGMPFSWSEIASAIMFILLMVSYLKNSKLKKMQLIGETAAHWYAVIGENNILSYIKDAECFSQYNNGQKKAYVKKLIKDMLELRGIVIADRYINLAVELAFTKFKI